MLSLPEFVQLVKAEWSALDEKVKNCLRFSLAALILLVGAATIDFDDEQTPDPVPVPVAPWDGGASAARPTLDGSAGIEIAPVPVAPGSN